MGDVRQPPNPVGVGRVCEQRRRPTVKLETLKIHIPPNRDRGHVIERSQVDDVNLCSPVDLTTSTINGEVVELDDLMKIVNEQLSKAKVVPPGRGQGKTTKVVPTVSPPTPLITESTRTSTCTSTTETIAQNIKSNSPQPKLVSRLSDVHTPQRSVNSSADEPTTDRPTRVASAYSNAPTKSGESDDIGSPVSVSSSASEPSASEPSASEPSASEPSANEPSASEPSASEPSADRANDEEEVEQSTSDLVNVDDVELAETAELDEQPTSSSVRAGSDTSSESTPVQSIITPPTHVSSPASRVSSPASRVSSPASRVSFHSPIATTDAHTTEVTDVSSTPTAARNRSIDDSATESCSRSRSRSRRVAESTNERRQPPKPEPVRFYTGTVNKIKSRAYVKRIHGIRVVLYDFGGISQAERRQLTAYYRAMLSNMVKRTESLRLENFDFRSLETLEEIYGAFAWVKRHTAIVRSMFRYRLILMGVLVVIEFLFKLFIPMDGFVLTQMKLFQEYDDLIYEWSERQGNGLDYPRRRGKRARGNPLTNLCWTMTIQVGLYMMIGVAIKYFGFNVSQPETFSMVHGFMEQVKSGESGTDLLSKVAGLFTMFMGGSGKSSSTSDPEPPVRSVRSARTSQSNPLCIDPIE